MKNESGLRPVEYKVLVKPDLVSEKIGSILIPDQEHERMGWAQVKGTLVAMGARAFEDFPEAEKAILAPGARVYFDKHTGINLEGADGDTYRLITDKEVAGVVTDERAVPVVMGRSRRKLDAA